MNHHLHGELWKHLRTDNSGGEKRQPDVCVSSVLTDDATTLAHLPLKKIQPANTRGQRWHAWRMRAALSRRRGSTWKTVESRRRASDLTGMDSEQHVVTERLLNLVWMNIKGLLMLGDVFYNFIFRHCEKYLISLFANKICRRCWNYKRTLVESMVFRQLKMWWRSVELDWRWERYRAQRAAKTSRLWS